MHRRRFLAAGSLGLAGLAGCLGGDGPAPATDASTTAPGSGTSTAPRDGTATVPGGSDETTPPPDSTTPRRPTTIETPPSVSVTALQPGLIKMDSPDSTTVIGDAGTQYLLLSVSAAGTAPAREDLSLRFDGERHDPYRPRRSFPLWRVRNGTPYGDDRGSGWVLFELPDRGDAGDAALTWPGGAWPVPEPVRTRLAEPLPTLTPTVAVPDRLGPGETPTITVEVVNEGSVPGTFVAAIDREGPSVAHIPAAQVRVRVPAGETVTETVEDSFYGRPGGRDAVAVYDVTWLGGQTRKQVRVVADTTTAGG